MLLIIRRIFSSFTFTDLLYCKGGNGDNYSHIGGIISSGLRVGQVISAKPGIMAAMRNDITCLE
jgi:hypothetical protein